MDIGKIVSDVEIVRLDELERNDAPAEPAEQRSESGASR